MMAVQTTAPVTNSKDVNLKLTMLVAERIARVTNTIIVIHQIRMSVPVTAVFVDSFMFLPLWILSCYYPKLPRVALKRVLWRVTDMRAVASTNPLKAQKWSLACSLFTRVDTSMQ